MSEPVDPATAAAVQLFNQAFELATKSPVAALPLLDQMNRALEASIAETGADAMKTHAGAIRALYFVAYGRMASLKFAEVSRPSGEIADLCEKALREYRAAIQLGADTVAWADMVDSTALLLERCRPGGAHEILGSIKLKYLVHCGRFFLPEIYIQAIEHGAMSRHELNSLWEASVSTDNGIIRYALVTEWHLNPPSAIIVLMSNPQPLGSANPGTIGVVQLEKHESAWRMRPQQRTASPDGGSSSRDGLLKRLVRKVFGAS